MGTIIVGGILVLAVFTAIHQIYKDKKNGKGCSCGCENCDKGCH